jgi:hypothetical protein
VLTRTTLPKDTPLDGRLALLVVDLSKCHVADQDHCERNFDHQRAYWLLRGFLDAESKPTEAAEPAAEPEVAVAPSTVPVVPAEATAAALAADPEPVVTTAEVKQNAAALTDEPPKPEEPVH